MESAYGTELTKSSDVNNLYDKSIPNSAARRNLNLRNSYSIIPEVDSDLNTSSNNNMSSGELISSNSPKLSEFNKNISRLPSELETFSFSPPVRKSNRKQLPSSTPKSKNFIRNKSLNQSKILREFDIDLRYDQFWLLFRP